MQLKSNKAKITLLVSSLLLMTGLANAGSSPAKYAYVPVSNGILMYQVDSANGQLTALAASKIILDKKQSPNRIEFDPSGKYAYVTSNEKKPGDKAIGYVYMYKVNSGTGELIALNPNSVLAGVNPEKLQFDPSGKFAYVLNWGAGRTGGNKSSISMYKFDANTGNLMPITSQPLHIANGPKDMKFDASGKFVYVVNTVGATISIYQVDQVSGNLTALSPTGVETGANSWPAQIVFN